MKKKKSRLVLAQEEAQASIDETNVKIAELGENTGFLYNQLTSIQELFDGIRNVPNDKKLEYEKLKETRLEWKSQVDKIENDYKNASVKDAGAGIAGAGVGVAVVTLGPTAAMGVATTFGVASTGTAISSLSGAAATNAALAWLGGGALAVNGGGMAAGNALLAMAGPVGWAIAGVSLLASGLLLWKTKSDKKHIEDIFTLISQRDIASYNLAIVELNERIERIKEEGHLLEDAIEKIASFGIDYRNMTEAQQYELGSYVNLMNSSTQLLVNPILGLLPKYNENDYDEYVDYVTNKPTTKPGLEYKDAVISLANFLYKIDLDEKDRIRLWKTLRKNKTFLNSIKIAKGDFTSSIMNTVYSALDFKYKDE